MRASTSDGTGLAIAMAGVVRQPGPRNNPEADPKFVPIYDAGRRPVDVRDDFLLAS